MLGPLLALLLTLVACAPEKPVEPEAPPPRPPAFFKEPYFDPTYSPHRTAYASPMTDPLTNAKADYRPICTERMTKEHINGASIFSNYIIDARQFEVARAELAERLPAGSELQLIHGIPIWIAEPNGKSVLDVEMCFSVKEVSPRDALRAFSRSLACALGEGYTLKLRMFEYPDEMVGPQLLTFDTGKVKAREALLMLLSKLPVKCRVDVALTTNVQRHSAQLYFKFYKDGAPLSVHSVTRHQYADAPDRKAQSKLDRTAETPWPDCSCE